MKEFTQKQKEFIAWGEKFLSIWEANVVDKFARTTHELYESIVLVSSSEKITLSLELFDRGDADRTRNHYYPHSSTNCSSIAQLNLCDVTVARIFATYGVHKGISNPGGNVLLFCEGIAPEMGKLQYNLTILEKKE